MNTLIKLNNELKKIDKQLEKYRNKVAEFSMNCPRTQRRWKAERNWDYYANKKFELLKLIEEQQLKQNQNA